MTSLPWRNILSGVIFGAALTAAGMYSPSTIIGQMNLTSFHMMKGFLAGSATSALAILLAQRLSISNPKPRTPATIAIPSFNNAYNGNLIGGVLLGLGMTLSGACPGTVFAQLGTGIKTSIPVLYGTALGGIIYSWLKPRIQASLVNKENEAFTKPTLPQRVGISEWTGLAIYEGICISLIAGALYQFPRNNPSLVHPVLGGVLIGTSQFTTLLLTTTTLGTSTAFEQIGDLFWWLFTPSQPRPTIRGAAFAIGAWSGSWLLTKVAFVPMPEEEIALSTARAILGGASLVIGSRIAGGCTSGHGISGMSMLSVASFATVGGMFAGGMGSAAMFRLVGY